MTAGALVNILKDLNMKSFSPLCSPLKFLQSTLTVYNYAFFFSSLLSSPKEGRLHEYDNIVYLVLCNITLVQNHGQSNSLLFGRLCWTLLNSGVGAVNIGYNVQPG